MWKNFFDLAKAWWKALVIPLLLGVLLGTGDVAKAPFAAIFPDRDSIGGVTFPLQRVPSAVTQSGIELVLIRQTMKPTVKIDFLRRGLETPSGVFAGLATESIGSATPLTGGLNGIRFLELEMPAKTLGGTSVMLSAAAAEKARYVVTIGDLTKDLSDPDDLVIFTKNEARRITIVHWLIIVSIAIVTFFVARSSPLQHPSEEQRNEDAQWV
jgi:hypothetical protein